MADEQAKRMAAARELLASSAPVGGAGQPASPSWKQRRPSSARAVSFKADCVEEAPAPPSSPRRQRSLAQWAANRPTVTLSSAHILTPPPEPPPRAPQTSMGASPREPAHRQQLSARAPRATTKHGLRLRVRTAQIEASRLRTRLLATPRAAPPPPPPPPPPPELFHLVNIDAPVIASPTARERERLEARAEHEARMASVAAHVADCERRGRFALQREQAVRGLANRREAAIIMEEAAAAALAARQVDGANAKAALRDGRGRLRPGVNAHWWWERLGGRNLEQSLSVHPTLGGSPVRLVDSRFLIRLAKKRCLLPSRQQIPEEAFVPLDVLRAGAPAVDSLGRPSLRIAFVSQ